MILPGNFFHGGAHYYLIGKSLASGSGSTIYIIVKNSWSGLQEGFSTSFGISLALNDLITFSGTYEAL